MQGATQADRSIVANCAAAAKLEAEMAALRGVAGIFAHDCSNPLQSLTVLLELTLDDSGLSTGNRTRIGQSLEAAKTMHHLMHDFTRLMRSPRHGVTKATFLEVVQRCLDLFTRRLDRQNVRSARNVGVLQGMPAPPREFEWAFVNVLLGMVSCAMTPGYRAYELTCRAWRERDDASTILEVQLVGETRSEPQTRLALPEHAFRLARQALYGTNLSLSSYGLAGARFTLPSAEG